MRFSRLAWQIAMQQTNRYAIQTLLIGLSLLLAALAAPYAASGRDQQVRMAISQVLQRPCTTCGRSWDRSLISEHCSIGLCVAGLVPTGQSAAALVDGGEPPVTRDVEIPPFDIWERLYRPPKVS